MVSISLPPSVRFPITVTAVLASPGQDVLKHQTLFKYKYHDLQDDPQSKLDPPPQILVPLIGTFETPVTGTISEIVTLGQTITSTATTVVTVTEPCDHAVQYGGLCALCGKAVEDEKDYSGFNYEERANIEMSHDKSGLRISYEEATKIEQNSTARLLAEKKLILVVDLDQTVIHATVDPTVGEWQLDPNNANYPAVKDVRSFCLDEERVPPPNWTGPKLSPAKCWYYVKLRPGLEQFLQEMSKYYEMHIYTMATRNYALSIAKIIDPDRKYFGDRILSRDESGSLTHKNLKRLFPVDQSMVAIIDDRGDVWQWEANLIKVVPYDFFVGIGDINSSFLPKKNSQITGPSKRKSIAKLSIEDQPESESRTVSLEHQQHDRPLAKLQHDLEKNDNEDELLYDDDAELETLNKALVRIHDEYYSRIDDHPDLSQVIPELKHKVLEGVVVLFLGIIPLGINPQTADIVIWCQQFGVQVVNDIVPNVTHVVCREGGLTFKVKAAKKLIPGVKIVNVNWLFACLSSWSRVAEEAYEEEGDWFVDDADIERYVRMKGGISVDDLDGANDEVDDFLAESDDDDDDEEEEEDENDEEDGEDQENGKEEQHLEEEQLQQEQLEQEKHEVPANGESRKRRLSEDFTPNKKQDVDLDLLEQELLDGLEDLE